MFEVGDIIKEPGRDRNYFEIVEKVHMSNGVEILYTMIDFRWNFMIKDISEDVLINRYYKVCRAEYNPRHNVEGYLREIQRRSDVLAESVERTFVRFKEMLKDGFN